DGDEADQQGARGSGGGSEGGLRSRESSELGMEGSLQTMQLRAEINGLRMEVHAMKTQQAANEAKVEEARRNEAAVTQNYEETCANLTRAHKELERVKERQEGGLRTQGEMMRSNTAQLDMERDKVKELQGKVKELKAEAARARERAAQLKSEREEQLEDLKVSLLGTAKLEAEQQRLRDTLVKRDAEIAMLKRRPIVGGDSGSSNLTGSRSRGSETALATAEAAANELRQELTTAHSQVAALNKKLQKEKSSKEKKVERLQREAHEESERAQSAILEAEHAARAELIEVQEQAQAAEESMVEELQRAEFENARLQAELVAQSKRCAEEKVEEHADLHEQLEAAQTEMKAARMDLRYLRSKATGQTRRKPQLILTRVLSLTLDPTHPSTR
ncbi:hypothetical protein CYMTET_14036, partial [Cymbomonas tetramitiformis]